MISLDPATKDERGTLRNLLQLYVHDWSELLSLDIGVDGRFDDYPLDVYWTEAWRPWEVRQRKDNVDATVFWRKVITRYTNGKYEELAWNDATWTGPVQRFTAPKRAFHDT